MKVGPFELVSRIAVGGMGQIWRADHRGMPVAVKFVRLHTPEARAMFNAEARAHARLQHPHILQVLDIGTLEEDIPWGPSAGTAWMALEYASGGDLKTIQRGLGWEGVRVVLLTLLDALAHAHARGVVHRDLKPANILLSTGDDPRPGLKLADFGIAHLVDLASSEEVDSVITGTPVSLAPEQCVGRFREYGPWTDLYALGCLAYRLASGSWPFKVTKANAATAHLERRPAPLAARFEVPPGFDHWVARLLSKSPLKRFRCAADAAVALVELGTVSRASRSLPDVLVASRATVEATLANAWGSSVAAEPTGAAPMAVDWRRRASPPWSRVLVDAGLQLFALRSWPTVGRDAQLDVLWGRLAQVRRTRRPQVVVLRGEPGVGISHLGRKLSHRAHALGAAHCFSIEASPDDGEGDGLLRLLREQLVTQGLSGEVLERCVQRNLKLWGVRDPALTSLLSGLLEGRVVHGSARRGAARRLIRDRITDRAGVLWIDDCVHCPDGLKLVSTLLRTAGEMPLLVVLGAGSATAPELDALEATTVQVDPLNPRESQLLLQHVLPIDPGLRGRILDDARGRPALIAYHLDHLVAAGALVPALEGYRLAEGRAFQAAGSVRRASRERAAALLTDMNGLERRTLVAAALLGDRVRHALWAPSCGAEVRLRVRVGVLDRLLAAGLVIEEGPGFRWSDRTMREAVLAEAEPELVEAVRRVVVHALHEADPAQYGIRIARLRREGGDLDGAMEAYLELMLDPKPEVPLRVGDVAGLCDEALEVADALGMPMADPIRDALVARALVASFETADSFRRARAVLETASAVDWPVATATAHALMAERTANADPEAFDRHLALARRLLADMPDDMLRADVQVQVIRALHLKRRNQEAFDLLMPLLERARSMGWARTFARGSGFESHIRKALGVPVATQALLKRADDFSRQGFMLEAASLLVDAGDQARRRGDLDDSDALNLRAIELCDLVGLDDPAAPLNLCVNAIIRKQPDEARRWLDEGISRGGSPLWRLALSIIELSWACIVGDLQLVRAQLKRLRSVRSTVKRDLLDEEAEMLQRAAADIAPRDPGLARMIRELD